MFYIELNGRKYSFEKFTYTKEYDNYSTVEILDLYPYAQDDSNDVVGAITGNDKKEATGNKAINPSSVGLNKGVEVNFKLHFKMSRFTYNDRHGAEAVAFEGIDTASDVAAAPLLTYKGLVKSVETLYVRKKRKWEYRLVITDEFANESNSTNQIFDMPSDNEDARNVSKTITQPMDKVTNPQPPAKLVSADMFPTASTSSSIITTSHTKYMAYAASQDYGFSIYDTQRPKRGPAATGGDDVEDATVEIKRIGKDRANTLGKYHLTLPQDVKSGKTTLLLNKVRQIARNNVVYDGSMTINPIEYYKDLAMSKTRDEDPDKAKMRGNVSHLLDETQNDNPSDKEGENALPTMYSPFEFNESKQDAKAKVLGRKDYKIFERSEYEMQFASIPTVTVNYLTQKEASDIENKTKGSEGKVTFYSETSVSALWDIGYANMGCVICKRRFVKEGEGTCNSYIKLSNTPIIRDMGAIYPIDPEDKEWSGWENHPCGRMKKVADEFIKKVGKALHFNMNRERAKNGNFKSSELTDEEIEQKKLAWVYDDTGTESKPATFKPKITRPFAEALYATLHWGTIIDHGFDCAQVCGGPLAEWRGIDYPRAADGFKACWQSDYNPFTNAKKGAPVFCNQVSDGSDPCQVGAADCHYTATQEGGGGSGKHQGMYNVYERQNKREADLYAYFIWQNGDVIVTESKRKSLNKDCDMKQTDKMGGMTKVNYFKDGLPAKYQPGADDEVFVPTRVMEMVAGPDEFFSDRKSNRWKYWEGDEDGDFYKESTTEPVYQYKKDSQGSFWMLPPEYAEAYEKGDWKCPLNSDRNFKLVPFGMAGKGIGEVVADPPGPPEVKYSSNEQIYLGNGKYDAGAEKTYYFKFTDQKQLGDLRRKSSFGDKPFKGRMYSRTENKPYVKKYDGTEERRPGTRKTTSKTWKKIPEGADNFPTWKQRLDYYKETGKIEPVWVFARPEMLGLIYPNGPKAGEFFNLFKEFPTDKEADMIKRDDVLVDGSKLKSNGRYNSFHASVLDWLADGGITEIGLRQSKVNLQKNSLRNDAPFEDFYYWRAPNKFTSELVGKTKYNCGTSYASLSPGYNPNDEASRRQKWDHRIFSYTNRNPNIMHAKTPSGLDNISVEDPQAEATDKRNLHPFKKWSVLSTARYGQNELDNYHYITHTVGETYGPHTRGGMNFNNSSKNPFGVPGHCYEHSYGWSVHDDNKFTYIHERIVPAVFNAVVRARLLESHFKVGVVEPPIPGRNDKDLKDKLKKKDEINKNVDVQGFFDKFPLDFITFDNEMPMLVAPKKGHDYILKRIVTEISNSDEAKNENKEFLMERYMKQFAPELDGPSEGLQEIRHEHYDKLNENGYDFKYNDLKDIEDSSPNYKVERVRSYTSGAILKKMVNADGNDISPLARSKLPVPHAFGNLRMDSNVTSEINQRGGYEEFGKDAYKDKMLEGGSKAHYEAYHGGYDALGLQSQRQESMEVIDYKVSETEQGFMDNAGHALMADDFSGVITTLTVAPATKEDRGDFVEDGKKMGIGDYEDSIK
ncbi:MAG TPA: hypothetical protein DCO86_02110 [Spirochaetaceae bacterium]|nr:hypothetical protein [Spirochaetaceae bacterium]